MIKGTASASQQLGADYSKAVNICFHQLGSLSGGSAFSCSSCTSGALYIKVPMFCVWFAYAVLSILTFDVPKSQILAIQKAWLFVAGQITAFGGLNCISLCNKALHKNVVRLEITMCKAQAVKVFHTFCNLKHDIHSSNKLRTAPVLLQH